MFSPYNSNMTHEVNLSNDHDTWECRSKRVGICVTRSSIISIWRRWRSACSRASSRRRHVRMSKSLSCSCLVFFFLRHCSKYNNVSWQIFKIIDSDCVPRGRSQGPPRWLTADQRLPDLQHLFPPLLFHSLPYLVLQFLSATNLRFSILWFTIACCVKQLPN